MTNLFVLTERAIDRAESILMRTNEPPRLFPLNMTEDAVRARVKSFGMYGEGRTAREWYAAACPWKRWES